MVMDERPHNAVDVIEGLSFRVKRELLADAQSTLRDLPPETPAQLLAEKQKLLFVQADEQVEQDDDELVLAFNHVVVVVVVVVSQTLNWVKLSKLCVCLSSD